MEAMLPIMIAEQNDQLDIRVVPMDILELLLQSLIVSSLLKLQLLL